MEAEGCSLEARASILAIRSADLPRIERRLVDCNARRAKGASMIELAHDLGPRSQGAPRASYFRAHLGASAPEGTLPITLFLPGVDRDGRPIDQESRLREALRVFGRLFRGATAVLPGRGVWRDEARGGELVFDDMVLVTSYVAPDDLAPEALRELRSFLHRLGRESRQGEVGIVIAGRYYGITDFDAAAP
jgi:hypothetical protein